MKKEYAEKRTTVSALYKPKSILEAFEKIVEKAEDSGLSDSLINTTGDYAELAPYISYASRKLKLTPLQTILLALFVDRSDDCRIRLYELAKFCGCRTTRMLRMGKEIDALDEKHYVRVSRSNSGISYRVPQSVLDALHNNQRYEFVPEPITDLRSFFDTFNELLDEADNDELAYDQLMNRTFAAMDEIADHHFVKKLRGMHMEEDILLLGIYMMYLFVENDDDNIGFRDIQRLFKDNRIPSWIKSSLVRHKSELFENNIIENVNDNGMARTDSFKVTESAKADLLAELTESANPRSNRDLERYTKFAPKQLIYNESEGALVEELSSILTDDRFREVQSRLEAAGMRKGFCCMFYGMPGTGKTETVYQIARATGRDIFRVDVDKIKSCWVGESEKNIKKLFDRYRIICKDSAVAPILLFNEADAVLGVRMEGAARAVDKMENSIQNIILQEMESIEGIMIATTNLTTNLDKAFERRFLYKIRFHRPTSKMRSKIWRTMLPDLKEKDAEMLASKFDLSGGQIENVVRRHTVNSILKGNSIIDIEAITDACTHEGISQDGKSLGFKL